MGSEAGAGVAGAAAAGWAAVCSGILVSAVELAAPPERHGLAGLAAVDLARRGLHQRSAAVTRGALGGIHLHLGGPSLRLCLAGLGHRHQGATWPLARPPLLRPGPNNYRPSWPLTTWPAARAARPGARRLPGRAASP